MGAPPLASANEGYNRYASAQDKKLQQSRLDFMQRQRAAVARQQRPVPLPQHEQQRQQHVTSQWLSSQAAREPSISVAGAALAFCPFTPGGSCTWTLC